MIKTVSRRNFRPYPKVDSCLLKIKFSRGCRVEVKSEKLFFQVVRWSFQHRRKTLLNSLLASGRLPFSRDALSSLMQSVGLPVQSRPERIELEDFAALADALYAARDDKSPPDPDKKNILSD
jgi:16S rRNA (adenine1518-N6/adenine1519-N6)-dimethyltransferase